MLESSNAVLWEKKRYTAAGYMLRNEQNGLAASAIDSSLRIKWLSQPGKEFIGDINKKVLYQSPSVKYILNSKGFFEPGNTLRCEYDGLGNPLGFRLEEARTNILLNSSDPTSSSWAKTSVSVSKMNYGSRLIEDLTTAARGISQQGSLTSAGTYTAHVVVKGAGRNVNLWLREGPSGSIAEASFNLSSGAATITGMLLQSGWTSPVAYTIRLAHGWYICVLTATTSGTSPKSLFVRLNNGVGSNPSYLGGGSQGIDIWNSQIEPGSFHTSPIITGGTSIQRVADNLSVLTSEFPYNQPEGTLYAKFRMDQITTNGRVLNLSAGAYTNRVLDVYGSAGPNVAMYNGSGYASRPIILGAFSKVAVRYKTSSYAISANGSAVSSHTSPIVNTATILQIGQMGGGASTNNFWMQELAYLPYGESDSGLTSRSAL